MLNFLRQRRQNILIKIILGVIILSFAAFFGATTLSPGARRAGTPARVNGEDINPQLFAYVYNSQLDKMRSLFKEKIPENFLNNIRQSVLGSLINRQLIVQNLKKLGLGASPDEVADYVKNDPLARNPRTGEFDFDYYVNNFLPGFQYSRGISYERYVKDSLASQKLFAKFEAILSPTDKELEWQKKIRDTRFEFEVIKIDKEDKAIAQKIFADWKAGRDIGDQLKKKKFRKTKTPKLTYTRLRTVFGGKADIEHLKTLTGLTKKHPFPTEPIKEGRFYYLVKMVNREQPDEALTEEEKAELKQAYQDQITQALQNAYVQDLRENAEIKVYEFAN